MRHVFFFTGIVLLPIPCTAGQPVPAKMLFERAIIDACQPEQAEVSNLLALTRDTPGLRWNDAGEVLMVTWKSLQGCQQIVGTGRTHTDTKSLMWVTAVPQVSDFCRTLTALPPGSEQTPIAGAELDLRLQQYLGLPPRQGTYKVFIEIWVKPEMMFRVCNDPETDDTTCDPKTLDPNRKVSNIPDYAAFLGELRHTSCKGKFRRPWTGLGYTYRWGGDGQVPANEVGASEFALIPGASYRIESVSATSDYCRTLDARTPRASLSCPAESH